MTGVTDPPVYVPNVYVPFPAPKKVTLAAESPGECQSAMGRRWHL